MQDKNYATAAPAESPTKEPTASPVATTTDEPTKAPTSSPVEMPTLEPTATPTEAPLSPTPSTCSSPGEVSFTVEILTDFYPGETTWTIANEATGTVAGSGGPYNTVSTLFSETICIPEDACLFTINDSFGDGICCSVSFPNVYCLLLLVIRKSIF